MRLVLDGKSVAVGLFAGAALVAGLGAVQNEQPQTGRFQVETAGTDNDVIAYVVDTATGRVWREHASARKDAIDFLKPKLDAAE